MPFQAHYSPIETLFARGDCQYAFWILGGFLASTGSCTLNISVQIDILTCTDELDLNRTRQMLALLASDNVSVT